MDQNKTGRYFKYAIGEIILVVIGILIALQINNWNETNKLKKEEQEVLSSLKEELKTNTKVLTNTIIVNEWINKNSLQVLDSIDNGFSTFEKSSILRTTAHNPIDLNFPVLQGILDNEGKLITKKKLFISKLRAINSSHEAIKKALYYLDENYNIHLSSFSINCGFDFRTYTSRGKKISLKELEKCSYHKEKFKAMVSLTNVLMQDWIDKMKTTQKQSEFVLKKLDSLQ